MSIEYLGSHFDIHTGGVDHIPVHHTNEIAQSEAYLDDGRSWVRWWLHGEFINLRGAKISKSTGGGALVEDLIAAGFHPLVYRYLLLQAHYRSQMEYSDEAIEAARAGLRRMVDRFAAARTAPAADLGVAATAHLRAFDDAVSDDLNTARALAVVTAASRDEAVSGAELSALALEFDAVLALGFSDLEPADLDLRRAAVSITVEQVEAMVAERLEARAARNFARSDELRQELAEAGVLVEDQPGGVSTWRWA
jgi:cysteinyl-tRNA synthetase